MVGRERQQQITRHDVVAEFVDVADDLRQRHRFKFCDDPQFTPELLEYERAPQAATTLCVWVRAMKFYKEYAKAALVPKRQLEKSMAKVKEEQAKLQALQDFVANTPPRSSSEAVELSDEAEGEEDGEEEDDDTTISRFVCDPRGDYYDLLDPTLFRLMEEADILGRQVRRSVKL